MKFRHAAALALVAWFLLYPPWSAQNRSLDPSLPLDRWYQVAEFTSLADCEANKSRVLEDMEKKARAANRNDVFRQVGGNVSPDDRARMRHFAQCVSANDSRLSK